MAREPTLRTDPYRSPSGAESVRQQRRSARARRQLERKRQRSLLDFGVGYDRPNDGPFDIRAGYDFSDLLHDELDEFDVRTHRGSSTLSYDLGSVDTGALLTYAYAELDGEEFLS